MKQTIMFRIAMICVCVLFTKGVSGMNETKNNGTMSKQEYEELLAEEWAIAQFGINPEPPDMDIQLEIQKITDKLIEHCNYKYCLLLPFIERTTMDGDRTFLDYPNLQNRLFSLNIGLDLNYSESAKDAAHTMYYANVDETLVEHRISPRKLKDSKEEIWVCGFNFCQNFNKRFYEAFLEHENVVYSVSFSGHAKYFNQLIPLFETIIRSIKFNEPTP